MRYAFDDQNSESYNLSDRDDWLRSTDVQHVWRKHGWVPPSEYRRDFQKNVPGADTRSEAMIRR